MIDQSIIKLCIRKDRKAFQQCYEACAPYVYSIIKQYIHNVEERKDVMQEVFAHIFNSIEKFDEKKASFKTWMSRISINQTINYIKKNKKHSFLITLHPELEHYEEEQQIAFDQINKTVFKKVLKKMPTGYRTIFLLYHVEGYAHGEISSILDINEQTSRSQLSRALKWLRKHYKEQLKAISYG